MDSEILLLWPAFWLAISLIVAALLHKRDKFNFVFSRRKLIHVKRLGKIYDLSECMISKISVT